VVTIYHVVVGVCLVRPPAVDEYRKVVVAADGPLEAELLACQIAACTSEMPVCSRLLPGALTATVPV
jgi:hypothetical protein